jgi:hypothetical protein
LGRQRASFYWSSTTFAGNPGFVRNVDFGNGLVANNNGVKAANFSVRAVRGGS